MGKQLIAVGSVTYAMKGKEILAANGISSYIQKTSKPREGMGCGYSLYVPKNYSQARMILAQNGIRILNGYQGDEESDLS